MNMPQPPRWSAWMLNWLLSDDWQTPAGDFEEAFNLKVEREGAASARRWYRGQVVRMLPGRIKEKLLWGSILLGSNLKVAVRTLRKHPAFAAITMGGLAVGLAAAILIALFVQDELAFDRFHADADRIVRVLDEQTTAEGGRQILGYSPPGLARDAVAELPDVEAATRFYSRYSVGRQTVEVGEVRLYEGSYLFADPSFLDVFDFRMVQGNPETALSAPATVLLTESAARRYFGDENPVGMQMRFEREGDLTVVGVLSDPPRQSHLQFSMLISLATFADNERMRPFLDAWDGSWASTYLRLSEGTDPDAFAERFDAFVAAHRSDELRAASRLFLQPLSEVHFGSAAVISEENAFESSRNLVWIVGTVALFIILIASINYTNMATASSLRRSREVAMRKAVGANRGQVAGQFFSESLVLVGLSLIAALLLVGVTLPGFSRIAGKEFHLVDLRPTSDPISKRPPGIQTMPSGAGPGGGAAPAFGSAQPAITRAARATNRKTESVTGSNRDRRLRRNSTDRPRKASGPS